MLSAAHIIIASFPHICSGRIKKTKKDTKKNGPLAAVLLIKSDRSAFVSFPHIFCCISFQGDAKLSIFKV